MQCETALTAKNDSLFSQNLQWPKGYDTIERASATGRGRPRQNVLILPI